MNAKDLALEWEAGSAAADSKYGGKTIEVEGSVKEYGANYKNGKPDGGYVQIGNMDVLFKDVRCEIAETDLWKKIAKKSKVKIKGLWLPTLLPDRRTGVAQPITRDKCSLELCVFTEIGPNPRIKVTAEELSETARIDEGQFQATYGDYFTEAIVTAEIEAVEHIGGQHRLVFKTSASPRVIIDLGKYSADKEAIVKAEYPPGTKVSLVGQYNPAMSSNPKKEIYLHGTLNRE